MPATAGRVRMPANNRVHSSAALQTHGIWQSAIGYDPYAPDQKQPPPAGDLPSSLSADQQNMYDSFQGLLALARLTGSNADEARGACRRCGRVGHLPFQCRNFLKDGSAVVGAAAATAAVASNFTGHGGGGNGLPHRKGRSHDRSCGKAEASSDSSSDDKVSDIDDSEISDSSADSGMERAIAAKFGRNVLNSVCKRAKSTHLKDLPTHKRSHSKKHKFKKVDERSENSKRKSKHSLISKRRWSSSPDFGSIESSEEEHRKKRKRHSHKHVKSRSEHHRKHSKDSFERKSGRHSKKQKSSHKCDNASEVP